jgi:hypothetical protein
MIESITVIEVLRGNIRWNLGPKYFLRFSDR